MSIFDGAKVAFLLQFPKLLFNYLAKIAIFANYPTFFLRTTWQIMPHLYFSLFYDITFCAALIILQYLFRFLSLLFPSAMEKVVERLEDVCARRTFLFQQWVGGLWQGESLGEDVSLSPNNNLIKCVCFWNKPYAVGNIFRTEFQLLVILVAESGNVKGVGNNCHALIISNNGRFACIYSDIDITNWQLRLVAHHNDLALRTNGNAQSKGYQNKSEEKWFHWL